MSAICRPNPWAMEGTTYRREFQLDPVNHSPATGTLSRAPQGSDMAQPWLPCPVTFQAIAKSTCIYSLSHLRLPLLAILLPVIYTAPLYRRVQPLHSYCSLTLTPGSDSAFEHCERHSCLLVGRTHALLLFFCWSFSEPSCPTFPASACRQSRGFATFLRRTRPAYSKSPLKRRRDCRRCR
jgi:hypothetical protein